MRYLQLDENGDFDFNAPWLVNSPACVQQSIETRLALWKGQWFLNQEDGTDYRGKVLGKNFRGADAEIQRVILGTQNVNSLSNYVSQFNGNNRTLSISADVDTAFGMLELETQLDVVN